MTTQFRILALIKLHLDVDIDEPFGLDTNLFTDYGADSLDLVEVTLMLEDEFRVDIADEDLPALHEVTPRKFVDLVERLEKSNV